MTKVFRKVAIPLAIFFSVVSFFALKGPSERYFEIAKNSDSVLSISCCQISLETTLYQKT